MTDNSIIKPKYYAMKHFLLATMLFAFGMTTVSAQGDPWITKAYNEIYNRNPTVKESIIKNYNNGSWNSYAELVSYIVTYNNALPGTHIKGDPWIFKAYYEIYNRAPIAWELNINNYNNGSWANYDELKKFIAEYQNALVVNRLKVIMAKVKSATNSITELAAVFTIDGKMVAVDLIGNDAGSLTAVGGNAVAAKGATTLIGMDGATLISDDGSTLKSLQGVQFSTYSLNSTEGGKKIKTSGKTTLLIR